MNDLDGMVRYYIICLLWSNMYIYIYITIKTFSWVTIKYTKFSNYNNSNMNFVDFLVVYLIWMVQHSQHHTHQNINHFMLSIIIFIWHCNSYYFYTVFYEYINSKWVINKWYKWQTNSLINDKLRDYFVIFYVNILDEIV